MTRKTLIEKLRNSKILIAPVIAIYDPSVAEMVSYLNSDFIIVDMEHSVIGIKDLQNIVIASKPVDVIARIKGIDRNEIKKVIDTGVLGIIIPGIETTDDAKNAVLYSKSPPFGVRGMGPGRTSKYGLEFNEYKANPNNFLIIIQIETKKAFQSIEEILSVDGIDGCFIGPVDLSISMNFEFSWDNKIFLNYLDTILLYAKKFNLITGIYSSLNNNNIQPIIDREFNFIMYGTDREALLSKYSESINLLRRNSKNNQ